MAERGIHEPLSEKEDDIARLDFANKGHVDHIKYLDEKLAAFERERDELRELLRHAANRTHENADWCSGCEAIRKALQQPEGEKKER